MVQEKMTYGKEGECKDLKHTCDLFFMQMRKCSENTRDLRFDLRMHTFGHPHFL